MSENDVVNKHSFQHYMYVHFAGLRKCWATASYLDVALVIPGQNVLVMLAEN